MKDYNAREKARWAMEFERTVDKMEIIGPIALEESNPFSLNPNLTNFWVNVTKQSESATEAIRKHGPIPEGFNNIAVYYPGQKLWGLKFTSS